MLGSMLIVVSLGTAGLTIARNYSVQTHQIRCLRSALTLLETEMVYGSTPLPDALESVGRRLEPPVAELFFAARRLIKSRKGYTAGEAWDMAIREVRPRTVLDGELWEILKRFGHGLGLSDKGEQQKNFRLALELLQREEIKAEEERSRNGKLWRYAGFMVGAVIVLGLY